MGSASMLAQPEGLGTGWCRTSVGLSYELASASVAAALPLCAFWLHACTRRLRPGGARILAAAPVVAANLMLCRLFCGGRSQWEVRWRCWLAARVWWDGGLLARGRRLLQHSKHPFQPLSTSRRTPTQRVGGVVGGRSSTGSS